MDEWLFWGFLGGVLAIVVSRLIKLRRQTLAAEAESTADQRGNFYEAYEGHLGLTAPGVPRRERINAKSTAPAQKQSDPQDVTPTPIFLTGSVEPTMTVAIEEETTQRHMIGHGGQFGGAGASGSFEPEPSTHSSHDSGSSSHSPHDSGSSYGSSCDSSSSYDSGSSSSCDSSSSSSSSSSSD